MTPATAFALRRAVLAPWLAAAAWVFALLVARIAGWRTGFAWGVAAVLTIVSLLALRGWTRWRRERVIREAPLPRYLQRKLREAYPRLAPKDVELVERGLRQFFLACHRSPGRFVAMPSRVVDAMWHAYILHTQAYRDWCALALGRFLHHTPAEAMGPQGRRNDGLRRAWFWACKDEAIDPRHPTRLPLLFALDAKLAIEDGFRYVPDCSDIERRAAMGTADGASAYCATHFADGSAPGDGGDFGGVEASSDGGGSSDGDGGGGDGGGGCGGGGGD